MSGWYFGKVAGLLGVYDNEPSNDLMTPDSTIEESLDDFVNSWRLPGQCFEEEQSQKTGYVSPNEWDKRKCEVIFKNDTSPLLPCFSTVDPKPFKEMCLIQSGYEKSNPSIAKGFCQVAGAYIDACKESGVVLKLPGECHFCDVPAPEPPIRGGGFFSYLDNSAPKTTDVVLVLQHGPCLEDFDFKTLINQIERSLLEEGLADIQYSVIGYGGLNELNEPHTFTIKGRIFNSHEDVFESISR